MSRGLLALIVEGLDNKKVEFDLTKIIRNNPRWSSMYYTGREYNKLPFGDIPMRELSPVQCRIMDIARFYDVLYQLGEDIPESILDSLPKSRQWYENYSNNLKKERKKAKNNGKIAGSPYSRKNPHCFLEDDV